MNKVTLNSIELLLKRQSNPLLTHPAPSKDDLETILAAGIRVPDHGGLTPWHFTLVQNQGLETLSQLFVQSSKNLYSDEVKHSKAAKMPSRAPLIIAVSTNYKDHPKVPFQEQLIAAGCCVHAMQMAAFSLGYGAMWRTGEMSYSSIVKAGLNIDEANDIVGFLYIGSIVKQLPCKPDKDFSNFISYL